MGRASAPCSSRAVTELPNESPLQPQAAPQPGSHTGGSAGALQCWEASLRFAAGMGKDAPRWPRGLGHCRVSALGSHSPLAPFPRPAARGSLASAPFPLETSCVFHLHRFSSFFCFNIFFNAMLVVRLKSFVGFFFVCLCLCCCFI